MTYKDISDALSPHGLICRGATALPLDDPIKPGGFLVMVGNAGPQMWRAFAASSDLSQQNPMDAWTRQVVDPIASEFKAQALYPFDGPPYHPFQQWAQRAEPVFPSPIGPLVHPVYGLWHAYRAALVFDQVIGVPEFEGVSSPCESCADKPCLKTCPVGAFGLDHYNVPVCVDHLDASPPTKCGLRGCMARHACPVGQDFTYEPEQAQFHMEKFVSSQRNPRF